VKTLDQNTNSTNQIIKSWVEDYTDTLYSWAFYKVSDQQTAEDLVQETFLAACKYYKNFKGKSKPKTWLFSILNNKIIDHYRKKSRNPIINESHFDKEGGSIIEKTFDGDGYWKEEKRPEKWDIKEEETNLLDNGAFNEVLQHCMAKLPSQWGMAVQLKYLQEKDGKDIGQELGISTSNYWQIIHRAKLSLRECLEKLWFQK
jgi:RNA polymerase sigma-70 factor (ECF subfamily)